MFEEPEDDNRLNESASDPAVRAKEKADEYRIHAEIYAVFEGTRKFDAQLHRLDSSLARDIQKRIGKLEKERSPETPLLPGPLWGEAMEALNLPQPQRLATNDYHVNRRPGEVLIVRWIEGPQVESFYERLQAHFDAGFKQFKEEERQSNEWRQEAGTKAYLDALDKLDVKMAERYLRPVIKEHRIFVLSTLAADEMDISHLCDYVMGVPAAEIVGKASAPPDDPTEQDRAWFFKLFSLRGMVGQDEKMCFFAYLQKSDDSW